MLDTGEKDVARTSGNGAGVIETETDRNGEAKCQEGLSGTGS